MYVISGWMLGILLFATLSFLFLILAALFEIYISPIIRRKEERKEREAELDADCLPADVEAMEESYPGPVDGESLIRIQGTCDSCLDGVMKSIIARLDNHYKKINNKYGIQPLKLEVESGRMNGEAKQRIWYRMPKKDYSKRYSTNCLSAIFEGDEYNTISIADLKEYADIMATADELQSQNSHFQNDVRKMRKAS